jgi:hypothetical protein
LLLFLIVSARVFTDYAVALDVFGAHLHVGVYVSLVEARELKSAGGVEAPANGRGGLTGIFTRQLLVAKDRHFELDVDAVEQRTGDARAIALHL